MVLVACSGAPAAVPVSEAQTPAQTAAAKLLADAGAQAGPSRAVVVLATADWCEPCNELHQRFVDAPESQTVLAAAVVREVDVDQSTGRAVAAQLRVLGYPTTVVLRHAPAGLQEVGRIEGFDSAQEYKQTLQELLVRTAPVAATCQLAPISQAGADGKPPVAALRCASDMLRTPQAPGALAVLRQLAHDEPLLAAAVHWPEPARKELLAALRLMGRYFSRILNDHATCAATFGRLAAWPGVPPANVGALHYWQAKCTLRAQQPEVAQRQLESYLTGAGNSAAGRELVADWLVHEALELPWGPPWALQLLRQLVTEQPGNHWAHYLLAALHTRRGSQGAARDELDAALRLVPDSAIYKRHRQKL